MNLRNNMMSETSQTLKKMHVIWFHLYDVLNWEKLIYDNRESEGA